MIEIRLTKERVLMMNGENHENSNSRWYTFLGRALVEEALKEGMKLQYLIAERTKKFS